MSKPIVFAENLKHYRTKRGYTQKQLADRIGYTEKSVSKWESGHALPTVALLLQLAEFNIGRRGDDVYTFCRRLKKDKQLTCLGFIELLPVEYTFGQNFHILWKNAVESGFTGNREERELLLRFGEMLGRSDAATQLGTIGTFRTELQAISEQRYEALHKKGRLYRGTGLLFGIMAGILVL